MDMSNKIMTFRTVIGVKMVVMTLTEILGKQRSLSSHKSSALQYRDRMTNMTKEVRIIVNIEKVAVC